MAGVLELLGAGRGTGRRGGLLGHHEAGDFPDGNIRVWMIVNNQSRCQNPARHDDQIPNYEA
jgi:hypothetical protein